VRVVKRDSRETLVAWLSHTRYEVIPLAGVEERVAEHVPTAVVVTVTASPRKGLDPTLELAERLAARGYRAVPHLSARLVADEAHLQEVLQRLRDAGIDEVFVMAGDAEVPAGKYPGALELLQAMDEIGHGLGGIGITGYPESHPFIDDDVTIQSMWDKRRFATYIVSNICFDAKVISRWVARVRRRGVDLPIYVGLPSITDTAKLLRVSKKIGVGESVRFLEKNRNWLTRLLLPGAYSPTRLLARLAPDLSDPELKVPGIHVYTFNDVAKTEMWRGEMLGRLGTDARA
jgi:methylenetetrahydrofolate reductase (NADPH)